MKKIIIIILLGLLSTAIYSQDNNQQLVKKLVEKNILTQEEADNLLEEYPETETPSQAGTVEKVRDIFNSPHLKVMGFGLITNSYNNTQQVKNSTNIRIVDVVMMGKVVENLNYFLLVSLSNPSISELWGQWTPLKELNFKVGQQKNPLSIENQIMPASLEYIYNTRTVMNFVGLIGDVLGLQNGKLNNQGRDMGILAHGTLGKINDHRLLEYQLGIFQGTGVNTSAVRNNKDFATTVMLQPIKGFKIGGGAYFGQAVYEIEGVMPKAAHVRNRWIVNSSYTQENFVARAEWIRGKDGIIDKEGVYGVVSWSVVPKTIDLVGKIDYFNKNKTIGAEVFDYTAGINYWFYKACRVQMNYTYSDYSKKWGQKNSHGVATQLQIMF